MKTKFNMIHLLLLVGIFVGTLSLPAKAAVSRGWVTVNDQTYYYKDGKKVTGLKEINGYKYYFRKKNGAMVRNTWVHLNGKSYYFQENGQMAVKCWINYNNRLYYVNRYGVKVTQLKTINKKLYAFTKKGVLKQNKWVKRNGLYYRTDENGIVDKTEGLNAKDITKATYILYKSATLTVEIKKNRNYDCDFWTAHVKINNPSQLCSGLSFDTYGVVLEKTSEALKRLNGIIGINGSAFQYSTGNPGFDAVKIKDGHIYNHAYGTSYSLLAVSNSGI